MDAAGSALAGELGPACTSHNLGLLTLNALHVWALSSPFPALTCKFHTKMVYWEEGGTKVRLRLRSEGLLIGVQSSPQGNPPVFKAHPDGDIGVVDIVLPHRMVHSHISHLLAVGPVFLV